MSFRQVKNTPDDHVTRDYRKGLGRLGDLFFRVVDTSGGVGGALHELEAHLESRPC